MSLRNTEINQILLRWLDRYSPPMAMKEKPRAIQDEGEALLRVLLKFAPLSDYVPWVNRALDAMEYQMKTRAWPTKGELGAVCSNLNKEAARSGGGGDHVGWSADPVAINAGRIQRGEAVGDDWLYGRPAAELLASGRVTEHDLDKCRSALFFRMRDIFGEEKAREREAEMLKRNSAAQAGHGGHMHRNNTPLPDKRMPVGDYA